MAKLFDPLLAPEAEESGRGGPAAEVVRPRKPKADPKATTNLSTKPEREDPLKKDFRVFVALLWRYLGLPDPTPLQLSIAWWLQHGPDRAVIMAFRGCAKSWITAAYALWTLYCDPQKKVLVVSASLSRAIKFAQFCLSLIQEVPELKHLIPRPNQRQSGQEFDVGPARPDQSPSLKAAGITGQITGSRADLIVPDDVEIPSNAMTVLMREKISEAVKEFDAIIKPGGKIKYLGTPQIDDSLYNKLTSRGYTVRIWPARYPSLEERKKYGDKLAPFITAGLGKDPILVGTSTEPTRFTDADLMSRELSYGKSGFQLQFMLDTSLADAERYPLKLQDLVVLALDPKRGPDTVTWGKAPELRHLGLQSFGFDGDHLYAPAETAATFSKYSTVVAAIDSSGRGADETALAIVAELNGNVFLLYVAAWKDGYAPDTLKGIAKALVRWGVSTGLIESNFGDGMFLALLSPYVEEEWKKANKGRKAEEHGGTSLQEITSGRVQKEARILSVMEPLTQQHRLVVNSEVIEGDYKSIKLMDAEETRHRYSLTYQYSHLTREKDSLVHDDRLEAVAIAVAHFAPDLGVNPLGMARRRDEEREEEELERLLGHADEVGDWPRTKSNSKNRANAARPQPR
jgi:hypothetical protein